MDSNTKRCVNSDTYQYQQQQISENENGDEDQAPRVSVHSELVGIHLGWLLSVWPKII